MNTTTRARSSLVAMVVIALIFVGFSAVTYPALSSESDDSPFEDGQDYDSNGEARPTNEEGKDSRESDAANGAFLDVRPGLSGYIISSSTNSPIPGIQIVLIPAVEPPVRPDGTDDVDRPNVEDPVTDRPRSDDGERDTDRNSNWNPDRDPTRDPNQNPDRDDTDPDDRVRPVREDDSRLRVITDRNGLFNFPGVQRGIYKLHVIVNGVLTHTEKVVYTPSNFRPLKIVIRYIERTDEGNGNVLSGIVVNQRGQPIPGAVLQLKGETVLKDRPMYDSDQNPTDQDYKGDWNGQPPKNTDWPTYEDPDERPKDTDRPESNENPRPKDQDRRPVSYQKTVSGRDGSFKFRPVDSGVYHLLVEAKGYTPYRTEVLIREDVRMKVVLEKNERKSFKLSATPVDGDGDDFPDDVIISAFSEKGTPIGGVMILIDGRHVGSTSFQGWVLALDHRPGQHEVVGVYKEHKAKTEFFIRSPHGEPDPDPDPEPREFGSIKGRVMSDDGSVANAEILMYRNNIRHSTISGREGEFFFEHVPLGEYLVHVGAKGFHEIKMEIFIEHERPTYIEVFLEPIQDPEPDPDPEPEEFGSIRGFVYQQGDEFIPVTKALVELHGHDYFFEAMTNERGSFWFEEVPEGEYVIVVILEDGQARELELKVQAGEMTEVRIIFEL